MKPEEFAEAIKKSRELIKSGKHNACPCSQTRCEWHGKCFECVMIHRTKRHHLPECLQPILKDKLRAMAHTLELGITDERPNQEHWNHLYEVAPPQKE